MGFVGAKLPRVLAGVYGTCGIHLRDGGKGAIPVVYKWGKSACHRRETDGRPEGCGRADPIVRVLGSTWNGWYGHLNAFLEAAGDGKGRNGVL